MGKLKIGVLGAYRGRVMMNSLLEHPDAELVAVCDKYKPMLEKFQKTIEDKNLSIALYDNFDDFFKHNMDAVVLANYAHEHAPFAIKLLKSGRHVMSEVLPASTMAESVALVEAVEESGRVYAYAENYCYMLRCFEMWKRYQRGDIGEVTHAEGEYVHDCTSIWHKITYGERNHWRNETFSSYYCTHSIGPILTVTGLRPVRVVGFETPNTPDLRNLGSAAGTSAMILLQLENGATVKSLKGHLKREPSSVNYVVYGQKGVMETDRMDKEILNVYIEGEKLCEGEWENYKPENTIWAELAKKFPSHGGSDFYTTHFFIEKILGRPDGEKYSIDIYKALDMSMPGLLAYKSILNGNIPIDVPDFRNREERDKYRFDDATTFTNSGSGNILPMNSFNIPKISDEIYEKVKQMWNDDETSKV
jgi:predicted dehydrogenase